MLSFLKSFPLPGVCCTTQILLNISTCFLNESVNSLWRMNFLWLSRQQVVITVISLLWDLGKIVNLWNSTFSSLISKSQCTVTLEEKQCNYVRGMLPNLALSEPSKMFNLQPLNWNSVRTQITIKIVNMCFYFFLLAKVGLLEGT